LRSLQFFVRPVPSQGRARATRHALAARASGQNARAARAGVASAIRREFAPLDTVRLCRDTGRVLKQFSFAECAGGAPELVGASRERLQALLYEAADPERVVRDAAVTAVDASGAGADGRRPAAVLEGGVRVPCRLLVGADGVRSAVARSLGVGRVNFAGQAGYRGIASFEGDAPVAPRTVCQVRSQAHSPGL
jgi:2-polyprenyl-6-methoxyphenol hydroxylase-like FAD-dependent oxidoreductase